jgi:hypothetical protein
MVAQLVNNYHVDSLPSFPQPMITAYPEPDDTNHIQLSSFLQITLTYSSYDRENNAA